ERYAFFSFWERSPHFVEATFSEARQRFGDDCLPLEEINRSVHDSLDARKTLEVMDCVRWRFYPATRLGDGKIVWLPLDWFRTLSEFNGSSCGNTQEESLLQGICELVERHVCALVDRDCLITPTIDPATCKDPVLKDLIARFEAQGIKLVLKDFSCGMPVPTVGAIAWDPATFPKSSEIVFTAGTASSPTKAAVRAVTEVAQLAGDFCTNACYEASGLSKFSTLEECAWLMEGETVSLESLPSVQADDIRDEVRAVVEGLAPLNVYAVET
ncbi:MAG: YcaO-like family protein, partial [Desulfovibrionaceae bacterium]|nr:YcaO-like family protein [Desulfovibrionaceae bacterium]